MSEFTRQFWSQLQHWRLMKFIEHYKAFLTSWNTNDKVDR